MRLIDADLLKSPDEMTKVFNNLTNEMYGMLQLIDEQPTVEVPQWIPCSERLPKIYDDTCTSEIVLVQGYDKEIDYDWQAMGWYAEEPKQWYFAECKNTDKPINWIDIIAWQPLPSVWKGENNG